MKHFLIISLSILILFSCKKERLKGDEKKLAGEWILKKSLEESFTSTNCFHFIRNKVNDCKPTTLSFKKSGKIILKDSTGTYKYSILYSGPTPEYFDNYKIIGCNSISSDSINDYYKMRPIIYFKENDKEYKPFFFFNSSTLVIKSTHLRILGRNEVSQGWSTYHIFEKVN